MHEVTLAYLVDRREITNTALGTEPEGRIYSLLFLNYPFSTKNKTVINTTLRVDRLNIKLINSLTMPRKVPFQAKKEICFFLLGGPHVPFTGVDFNDLRVIPPPSAHKYLTKYISISLGLWSFIRYTALR